MVRKISCILLIDDDEPTTFFNEIILKQMDCSDKIIKRHSAIDALEFLKENKDTPAALPEVILLDINMPGMDGWGFLSEYAKLDMARDNRAVLLMLSSSENPDDIKRAGGIPEVTGFISKPLSKPTFGKHLKNFFDTIGV